MFSCFWNKKEKLYIYLVNSQYLFILRNISYGIVGIRLSH